MSLLQVPSFVKLCMMATFYETRVQVEVEDVVIGGSEAEEDAGEIVVIQFPISVAATLDTHM